MANLPSPSAMPGPSSALELDGLDRLRASLSPAVFKSGEEFFFAQLKQGMTLAEVKESVQAIKEQIQSELYEHVASQYESFVQISSGISDLDTDCKNMGRPLTKIRAAHAELGGALQEQSEHIQRRVSQKSRLLQRKAYIGAVESLHASITRLDRLVHSSESSAEDWQDGDGDLDVDTNESNFHERLAEVGGDGKTDTNGAGAGSGDEGTENTDFSHRTVAHSVTLERAGQLYAEAVDLLDRQIRGQGEHFDAFQSWLQRVHAEQLVQLNKFFVSQLQSLAERAASKPVPATPSKPSKSRRSEWHRHQVLVRCLRAYAVLGMSDKAESAIVQNLFRTFMNRNFTKGRVDLGGPRSGCSGLSGLLAAFSEHCHSVCSELLHAADAVDAWNFAADTSPATPSSPAPVGNASPSFLKKSQIDLEATTPSYDIIGNCMLEALLDALDRHTLSIFSPGIPSVFHKNHTAITRQFLPAFVNRFCRPSSAARRRLKSHAAYQALSKTRWKMPVYLSIIRSQVQSEADAALSAQALNGGNLLPRLSNSDGTSDETFGLQVTSQFWTLIQQRFNVNDLFPETLSGSLELAALLVYRFCDWCQQKLVRGSGGSGSQMAVLAIGNDLRLLRARLSDNMPTLRQNVVDWVTSNLDAAPGAGSSLASHLQTVEDCMVNKITDSLKVAWDRMGRIVASTCAKALSATRSIAPKLRPRDIPAPTSSSRYVTSVLGSLQTFMMRWEEAVPTSLRSDFVATALRETTAAFVEAHKTVLRDLPKLTDPAQDGDETSPINDNEYTLKVMKQVLLDCRDFKHQLDRFSRFLNEEETVDEPLQTLKSELEGSISRHQTDS